MSSETYTKVCCDICNEDIDVHKSGHVCLSDFGIDFHLGCLKGANGTIIGYILDSNEVITYDINGNRYKLGWDGMG